MATGDTTTGKVSPYGNTIFPLYYMGNSTLPACNSILSSVFTAPFYIFSGISKAVSSIFSPSSTNTNGGNSTGGSSLNCSAPVSTTTFGFSMPKLSNWFSNNIWKPFISKVNYIKKQVVNVGKKVVKWAGNLFNTALKVTLNFEGGYSNDKYDHGGETNKGITHTTYDAWRKRHGLSTRSVRDITPNEVNQIYSEYWHESGADKIKDKKLAIAVFDAGVNMGTGVAQKLLKQSGGNLEKFVELREQKYRSIAANDPSQRRYLNNWLKRNQESANVNIVA